MPPRKRKPVDDGAGQKALRLEKSVSRAYAKSLLLGLPTELQGMIVDYVQRPSELCMLCLTCKALKHLALSRLYEHVELVLPRHKVSVRILEQLIDPGADGLYFTKSLSISYRAPFKIFLCDDDLFDQFNDYDMNSDEEPSEDEEETVHRPNRNSAITFNCLIRLLLSRIPANQLESFKWRHDYIIGSTTLDSLARKHGRSIKELVTDRPSQGWNCSHPLAAFPNLSTLAFNSIVYDEHSMSDVWIGRAVGDNLSSLRNLTLGTERRTARGYIAEARVDAEVDQGDIFRNVLLGMDKTLAKTLHATIPLNLTSLHLCGLDARVTMDEEFPRRFRFSRLRTLTLESCKGSDELLRTLASSSTFTTDAHLTEFNIRYEGPFPVVKPALELFLSSFAGLRRLSVLLDNIATMPSLTGVIEKHGKTLETLLWEGKTGFRREWEVDTSVCLYPDPETSNYELVQISKGFPNLIELGISLDWVKRHHDDIHSIKQLRHLRTLNIRNWPAGSLLRTKVGNIGKFAATQFVEGLLHNDHRICKCCRPLFLNLIVIGSVSYGDVWGMANDYHSPRLCQYLRARFYHVSYPRDVKGKQQPLLTKVGEGTAAGLRFYSDDLRIFKSYWLK
ncbi:MAG: mitochondrial splicing system protein [Pleopsidium flavum]|nr:MAG: mitochondrial splicing system protein [Pleopsidium flavum]